jgi:hypothetical protein
MFWMIVTRFFCKTGILRDFPCTLKVGIYRSLKKGNAVYIIFFIKVKDSNELSIAANFFHCHLTGFLKDTSLHLCRSELSEMFWMIVTRFFCKTGILRDFPCTLKVGIFFLKKDFLSFH